MNIIYYFPEYNTPMFQWQRFHIINELACHGVNVETFNPLVYSSPQEANTEFVKVVKTSNYDLLLSSVCYEGIIFPEVLEAAHQKGIPSLLIGWDNLTVPFYDKKQASLFDLVWLTSEDTSYLYRKWGAKYIVLPYAANPFIFSYSQSDMRRRICFIGTPYGSRSLMINAVTSAGLDLDLYYGGSKNGNVERTIDVKYEIVHPPQWKILIERLLYKEGRKILLGAAINKIKSTRKIDENNSLHKFPSVPVNRISAIYSKYALCLASTSTNHTDVLREPLKIVNLRSFEIPMSGGLSICKYNTELAGYFEEGKEILFYKTNEELVDKVRFYTGLASEKDLFSMKFAARRRAENDHTWWNRFSKVFDYLGIKYDEK